MSMLYRKFIYMYTVTDITHAAQVSNISEISSDFGRFIYRLYKILAIRKFDPKSTQR